VPVQCEDRQAIPRVVVLHQHCLAKEIRAGAIGLPVIRPGAHDHAVANRQNGRSKWILNVHPLMP